MAMGVQGVEEVGVGTRKLAREEGKASVRRLRWVKVKECVHLTLEDLHTMRKHLI